MSYVFIIHDLAVIRAMAHRVLVTKDGAIVEQGEAQSLFDYPVNAYMKRPGPISTRRLAAFDPAG